MARESQAIKLATNKETQSQFQSHLDLYKQRKPYRLRPRENAIVPVEAAKPAAARGDRR